MTEPAIHRTVSVATSIERAFKVFTEDFADWWPKEYYIGPEPPVTAAIEPREGGRWFQRTADGTETDWGRVLIWDPPTHLVLTWQIGPRETDEWDFEPDPSRATRVDVRFIADGPASTRVELTHNGFRGRDTVHRAFDSPNGWTGILTAYRDLPETA